MNTLNDFQQKINEYNINLPSVEDFLKLKYSFLSFSSKNRLNIDHSLLDNINNQVSDLEKTYVPPPENIPEYKNKLLQFQIKLNTYQNNYMLNINNSNFNYNNFSNNVDTLKNDIITYFTINNISDNNLISASQQLLNNINIFSQYII